MKISTATEIKMMIEATRNDIERTMDKVDRLISELITKDDD